MSTIKNVQTFTALPQCSATPTSGAQFVNKTFTDANYVAIGSTVSLSGTNAWTGNNSFNTNLPTSSQTPTSGTQLITKTYADATFATLSGSVSLSGTNVWTGTNSFNTNLPTSSLAPSSGSQLITKTFGDATYVATGGGVSLSGTNAWTGTNTYNTNLPTSNLTVTSSSQLVTKAYGDGAFLSIQTPFYYFDYDNGSMSFTTGGLQFITIPAQTITVPSIPSGYTTASLFPGTLEPRVSSDTISSKVKWAELTLTQYTPGATTATFSWALNVTTGTYSTILRSSYYWIFT